MKKCALDVYVKDSRLKEVEGKFDRIKLLFNVDLKYGSSQGKQYMVSPGKWLEVIGSRENAVKARVSSYLCGPIYNISSVDLLLTCGFDTTSLTGFSTVTISKECFCL